MQLSSIRRLLTLTTALVLAGLPALGADGLTALLKQADADISAGDIHGASINIDAIIAQTENLKEIDPHLPAALMYKASLAITYQHLDEAESLIGRALECFGKLPRTHKVIENEARCQATVASLKEAQGKYPESEAAYLKSIELLQSIGDTDDQGPVYNGLGSLYFTMRRFGESEKAHRKALENFAVVDGKDSDNYICAANNLATALEHQRKYDESAAFSVEALKLVETKYGANSAQLLPILDNLATVYEHKKQCDQAEDTAKRALAVAESLAGKDAPSLWEHLSSLGLLYLDNGKYKLGEEQLLRAIALLQQMQGDNSDALSLLYYRLGNGFEATKEDGQAKLYYEKAIASTSLPKVKKVYDDSLAKLLKKTTASQ